MLSTLPSYGQSSSGSMLRRSRARLRWGSRWLARGLGGRPSLALVRRHLARAQHRHHYTTARYAAALALTIGVVQHARTVWNPVVLRSRALARERILSVHSEHSRSERFRLLHERFAAGNTVVLRPARELHMAPAGATARVQRQHAIRVVFAPGAEKQSVRTIHLVSRTQRVAAAVVPVERVVRREHSAQPARATPAQWEHSHRVEPSDPPAPRPVGWQANAPLTVEQITEQVMRQIDRRVVAARERLGRT